MRRTWPKLLGISGCAQTGAQVLTPNQCSFCSPRAYLDSELLSWGEGNIACPPAPPTLGQPSPPLLQSPHSWLPQALASRAPRLPDTSALSPIYVSRFTRDVWVCECQCCRRSECVSHPSFCHPSPVPREGERKSGGKTDTGAD